MLPQRFITGRPFFVLGVVLAAWLVLPVFVKRFLRVSFFEMQAPIDLTASSVRDLQDYWSLRTRSKNDLIAAGRDVGRVNAGYEVSLQQTETLRAEVSRLESLLRMPPFSKYRSEPARVMRRDFNGWWQRMIVRKGRNYGIPVGAPVIFIGGVVGKVTEVFAYTCVVEMTSSPGFRLAASVDGDSRPLSYQGGENPPFAPSRGIVDNVPVDVNASVVSPKKLVTSGLGGIFPPGLAIGKIVQLEVSPDGLFKTGDVLLDARLAEIVEVTILVPEPTESAK